MSDRLALAVALGLAAGCARDREAGASTEVLRILAEHHADDLDPEGSWIRFDEDSSWMLQVRRHGDLGWWTLRCEPGLPMDAEDRSDSAAPETITTMGKLSDGILALESPLAGSKRLHLCRFGGGVFLLPEETVRFDDSGAGPVGAVFERVAFEERGPLDGYLPGPEDAPPVVIPRERR